MLAALCLLMVCSLFMQYLSAVDYKTGDALSFSGLDMLKGATNGKSGGTPHPMLMLALFSCGVLLIVSAVNPKSAFPFILASAVALTGLLMFRFDTFFAEKREFSFEEGVTAVRMGWYLGAACMAAALAVALTGSVQIARARRGEERALIFENQQLPAGYRVPTVGQIIVTDFKRHWPVYLMILPVLVFYLVWAYGPMYGILIAFKDFSPRLGIWGSEWAGLKWFREFFRSPFAARTIRNTLAINLLNLVIGFPAPILLALMLNEMRSVTYKRLVQTVTYIPHFISLVVLCGLLIDFVSTDGVITTVLSWFGLTKTNLLGEARFFRSVYIGSNLWQHLGWNSIIYLSALAGIDQELYEAATIDGAGKLRQVWHITLPGITPTITILLILQIGSMMSVGYEKIILLYNPITYETADVVSSYVYRVGIEDADFARSTAVNLFNSIINFMLVVFANRVSGMLSETSLW